MEMNNIVTYITVTVHTKLPKNPYIFYGESFETKEEAIKYKNKMYKKIKRDGNDVTCDFKKKDEHDFFVYLEIIKAEFDPNFDY